MKSNNQPILSVNVKNTAEAAGAKHALAPASSSAASTPSIAQTLPPGQTPAEVLNGLVKRLSDPSRLDEVGSVGQQHAQHSALQNDPGVQSLLSSLLSCTSGPPQVAAGITYVLSNSPGDDKAVVDDLLKAVTEAAFNPELLKIAADKRAVSPQLQSVLAQLLQQLYGLLHLSSPAPPSIEACAANSSKQNH